MSKQKALLFAFIFFSFVLVAQNKKIVVGLSTSLDHNSYSRVEGAGPISFKGNVNFSTGLVFRSVLTEKISLSSGIFYSAKNYTIKLNAGMYQPISEGDPVVIEEDDELTYSNSFIDLPIELSYKLDQNGKTGIYAVTGFVNSFQISHKNEHTEFLGDQDAKTYKDYLLSLKLGMGFMFKTEKLGFFLVPQTRFYLTKVHQVNGPNGNPIHFGLELQILKL